MANIDTLILLDLRAFLTIARRCTELLPLKLLLLALSWKVHAQFQMHAKGGSGMGEKTHLTKISWVLWISSLYMFRYCLGCLHCRPLGWVDGTYARSYFTQPNVFLSSVEMNGGTVRDGARSAFGVAICKWKWRERRTRQWQRERSTVKWTDRQGASIKKVRDGGMGTHGSEGSMNLLLCICANKKGSQDW